MILRALRFLLPASLSLLVFSVHASTNGDNLIGTGAGSRSLGGTGVAAPSDVLGAISANPAGLSLLSGPETSEFDLSLTAFLPHVSASVGALSADSKSKTYFVPSVGIAGPLGDTNGAWLYGFAAYGVSGLGVDYRHTTIDTTLAPTPYPLVAGAHTELSILEIAPSIAYRISPSWSAGLALHIDYGTLDLGSGRQHGSGVGAQPGFTFKATDRLTFGASYVAPVAITYKGVTDFDGNGTLDNLKLESPQQVKIGIGYEIIPGSVRLATDVRWVNWGGAKGYKDFDWQDSWVYGLGLQFAAVPDKLTLRAGYNYGRNPVREHNGWNGTGTPANATNVQGNFVNNYYYETFRIIGFPAVVENHASIGFDYHVSARASLDVGYTHAFKNTVTEHGLNLLGAPVTLSSSLSEDSFELGFKYRY